MTSSRVVVTAIAALALVAAVDGVRSGGRAEPGPRARDGFRIDLESSRAGTQIPVASLRRAFPGPPPARVAVSKVAVAPDGVVAVALAYVPGGTRTSRAAIELWDGGRLLRAFHVPLGSFSLGLWFAAGGQAITAVGWDERAHVYDREGRRLGGHAYVAYETE